MQFSYKIDGLKELKRQLDVLPGRIAGRTMRSSLNQASRIIRDAAKKTARNRGYSRFTVKNIRIATQRDPNYFTVRVHVGVHQDAYWLLFIEMGVPGYTMQSQTPGKNLGFKGDQEWVFFGRSVDIPPRAAQPFLRPAYDQNIGKVLLDFRDRLQRNIEIELGKLGR